ncbi:putative outer membrane starch-binding protein [Anseongella ginsenosidimutans]|uniref:Putative outer membrane starch-binding protein n=1 Tax=Anseongella ginsenosidimutans TaxID=496056 RepID=A0A4R3KV62_9SPHI|nr:RagB/SusD family nutrient uptake outer membrane protein [Anseongella ginsenosidimutans]QEC51637.1 RagB/SusD family nutrient uptake outer membrane protein [Anseongella ginsenosidimutans]TCS88971.1 putative outer membrane starch-binding protein [Anseongella ginsenosidimutans]
MKKLILLISCLAGLTSCKKDFLDRYPQTDISPELFFKSEEDLSLYINGLLSIPGKGDYQADQNSDNTTTTAAIEIKNMMTGTPSSQTIGGGWSWGRLRDINYFLDNYGKAEVAEEVKAHYAGLARYYRAVFYFNMVQRYSDVPWYSHALNPEDEEMYKGRDPRALVVDSIMADLAYAAASVRESVPSGTPDTWAVKLFYARAALHEGTFRKYHSELGLESSAGAFLEKAASLAGEIISSGNFAVHNTGNPGQDYAALFNSQDLLSNSEVILANIYDVNKDRGSDINSTVFGDYEQAPSRDLVQTYLNSDGTRYTELPGYETFGFVQEFSNRDPRLRQTLAYPGWVRQSDGTPYVQRLNKNFTGYHQLKGYSNSTSSIINGSVDFPAYRYAEALLIYAEAKAELDQLTQADLDISLNLLRDRAGLPRLDMALANANPDSFLEAKYPTLDGTNKGVLLEIRRERRVEFALEGYRYDDLMRWHAGKLLENIPEGMYFPGLGKFDLTGDGIEDIMLIDKDSDIPAEDQKEKNSLGVVLTYYKAGTINDDVTVYLENGNNGGTMVTETAPRQFIEPKYYYRPIPRQQVVLNPELEQLFGWE